MPVPGRSPMAGPRRLAVGGSLRRSFQSSSAGRSRGATPQAARGPSGIPFLGSRDADRQIRHETGKLKHFPKSAGVPGNRSAAWARLWSAVTGTTAPSGPASEAGSPLPDRFGRSRNGQAREPVRTNSARRRPAGGTGGDGLWTTAPWEGPGGASRRFDSPRRVRVAAQVSSKSTELLVIRITDGVG